MSSAQKRRSDFDLLDATDSNRRMTKASNSGNTRSASNKRTYRSGPTLPRFPMLSVFRIACLVPGKGKRARDSDLNHVESGSELGCNWRRGGKVLLAARPVGVQGGRGPRMTAAMQMERPQREARLKISTRIGHLTECKVLKKVPVPALISGSKPGHTRRGRSRRTERLDPWSAR